MDSFINGIMQSQNQLNRFERIKSNAENRAAAITWASEKLAAIMVDVRTGYEIKFIESEATAVAKKEGGVLISQMTGHMPNGAGDYITEFLGLIVAGGGKNEKLAKAAYGEKKWKAAQHRATVVHTVCTPDNPLGLPKQQGPTISAARPGTNIFYGGKVAENMNRYLEKNPLNRQMPAGSPIALAYVKEELLFFTQSQWSQYLDYLKNTNHHTVKKFG